MPRDFSVNLDQLISQNSILESKLSQLDGQFTLLNKQIAENECKLKILSHKREIYTKAIELLTIIQETLQNKIKEGFTSIVTYALRYVFNDDYKFELNFDRRGNLQEIDFNVLPPNRKEATDIMDSSGGGVIDVVSFSLRIILMELSKPQIEGFVALDESFKHLSTCYLPNAYKLLKEINKKTNRQIILVTHQQDFINYADKAIKIGE